MNAAFPFFKKRTIFTLGYALALGAIAMLSYYSKGLFSIHSETATGSLWYFIFAFVPAVAYEGWMLLNKKKERSLSFFGFVGAFAYILLLTSIFTFSGVQGGGGATLFFLALKFLFFPLVLVFVTTAFGRLLLRKIGLAGIDQNLHNLLSLTGGLMAFISIHAILGFFWVFHIAVSLGLLAVFAALAYKEMKELFFDLIRTKWTSLKTDDTFLSALGPIVTGFFLVTLLILVSVNIVNIVRPFPIGWDDLGVYMNFPKLMALAHDVKGYGMVLWQTFTAIGFLGGSTTQAFFLNELGSLLAILSVIFWLKSLLPKKSFVLPLPLIAATIFMSMPMVIFQQAKDMKIDPALFAMSIGAIVALFASLKAEDKKIRFVLLAFAGAMAGGAFVMKFTTLMLIVAGLATIWYASMGLLGFFSFSSLFVAAFSALKLWGFLNIVVSRDGNSVLLASGILALLGISMFAYGWWKKGRERIIQTLLMPTVIFIVSVGVMLTPWIAKNLAEAKFSTIDVNAILNGNPIGFKVDYTKFLSKEELQKRQEEEQKSFLDANGNTVNEDFGRYFGYEEGINNYIRLPFNLTLQKNQGGEFTDITYLYLSLLPGALLLLSIGRILPLLGTSLFLGAMFVYYASSTLWASITDLFWSIKLPIGYAAIAFIGCLPFVFIHFSAKKKEEENTENGPRLVAFATMYSILFCVAAFGIVWYGISMYFAFLAVIVLSYAPLLSEDAPKEIAVTASIVFLMLSVPYQLLSALPHAWNNLPKDSLDFKMGLVTQNEATFTARPEYLKVLATLNNSDTNKLVQTLIAGIDDDKIKAYLAGLGNISIDQLASQLSAIEKAAAASDRSLAKNARDARLAIYDAVLYPSKDQKNSAGIYRIGTFLTFYISENRSRYYEDSLVTSLDRYVKWGNRDETLENMKKLGLKYLLVDLNAATIDRDPRHDLTRRYEVLLDLMKSNKLKLIETDSLCLKMALEEKASENFNILAGVNYRSYAKMENGQEGVILQETKSNLCKSAIAQTILSGKVSDTNYAFLKPYVEQAKNANITNVADLEKRLPDIPRGYMAAFEIQ